MPGSELPPPVTVGLEEPVRAYWLRRVAQSVNDRYAGVQMMKFPEDLRVYEHLLWVSRANVVIELGSYAGGSALWFRDRLRALAAYGRAPGPVRVVAVDVDMAQTRAALAQADPGFAEDIALVEADLLDPSLPDRVAALVPDGSRCLVVEDSAHVYDTTMAALRGFARFVPDDGWFVVEDGCVDVEEMRLVDEWPRGVLPAVRDWLGSPEGTGFRMRRDLEFYGISCHPEGFLQRVGAG